MYTLNNVSHNMRPDTLRKRFVFSGADNTTVG